MHVCFVFVCVLSHCRRQSTVLVHLRMFSFLICNIPADFIGIKIVLFFGIFIYFGIHKEHQNICTNVA